MKMENTTKPPKEMENQREISVTGSFIHHDAYELLLDFSLNFENIIIDIAKQIAGNRGDVHTDIHGKDIFTITKEDIEKAIHVFGQCLIEGINHKDVDKQYALIVRNNLYDRSQSN